MPRPLPLPGRAAVPPRRGGRSAQRRRRRRPRRAAVLHRRRLPDAAGHPGARDLAVGGTYTLEPSRPGFFDRFQSVFIHHFETWQAPAADYLATHALAIPTRTFRRHAGFVEGALPMLEDVEFSHRLRRAGCRLVMDPALQVRHIFNYSLAGSLRNAFRKARHWTCYSLGAGDLLADSGTASRELKFNVGAWCASAALLAAGAGSGAPAWMIAAIAVQAANAYASRGLFAALGRAHGKRFAAAAALYYLLLYPLAVGVGALAGAWQYGTRPRVRARLA